LKNTDALGNALIDYLKGERNRNITVVSSIAENDVISVDYLFRAKEQFPEIEKQAINLCKGKVLDVGAGSGCHSLELQNQNIEVKAIDISEGAVFVMKERGVNDVTHVDFFELRNEKYDTLLFLMNGVGISRTLDGLDKFLYQAKSLLNDKGQILLDSSNILYMFEEEDGTYWIDLNATYYGEVKYQMEYKDSKTEPFNWLFVDFDTLKEKAKNLGLETEMVEVGDHHDYLARLTIKNV
jgi:SAM-dependent methyltransferase